MIEARIAELEAEALAAEDPESPVDEEVVAAAARDVMSGASA